MKGKILSYSEHQILMLKESANNLLKALKDSKDPMALDFLNGDLGVILKIVMNEDHFEPFDDIPYFEKMTRDYLPSLETEYFNFYSWAMYGKAAFIE